MKFIDEAVITVVSGKGGPGCVSFRRERFVERGGPDGGDGGGGGSVVLQADQRIRTLFELRRQKIIRAKNGTPGEGSNRHGKNGEDRIISVPPGTLVYNADTEELIKDLIEDGDHFVVARGGIGGKGNKHFTTSTHRAPRFAQPGTPGQEIKLKLELKLLADVGIVGLPNAGKSTLISRISSARPKIADYPFTTIVPSLGMVMPDFGEPFAVADIPGIIEGAHDGTGLGTQFLRHVERTRFLIHLIDVSGIDPASPLDGFSLINNELALYSRELASKEQVVVLNKIDLTGSEDLIRAFRNARQDLEVHCISAATGEGVSELIRTLANKIGNLNDTH